MQKTKNHGLLEKLLKQGGQSYERLPSSLEDWQSFLDSIEETCAAIENERAQHSGSVGTPVHEIQERYERLLKEGRRNELRYMQPVEASKLVSVETLASGIAHELNNPLAAAKGFAQILTRGQNPSERVVEFASKIEKAAVRMEKIIDHIKKFTRASTSPEEWTAIDLNEVIEESFVIIRAQLKNEMIECQLDFEANLPKMVGDFTQIENVFQNLLLNSKDAFVTQTQNQRKIIQIKTLVRNGRIYVRYEDNAGGMPKNVLDRIFEPFFTTKATGQGTGLGMSICHGIVTQHKGSITVDSTLGVGSVFEVTFPIRIDSATQPT